MGSNLSCNKSHLPVPIFSTLMPSFSHQTFNNLAGNTMHRHNIPEDYYHGLGVFGVALKYLILISIRKGI